MWRAILVVFLIVPGGAIAQNADDGADAPASPSDTPDPGGDDDGDTPANEGEEGGEAGPDAPPADDGDAPPADDGETPPADDGETPPADDGETPPADGGDGQIRAYDEDDSGPRVRRRPRNIGGLKVLPFADNTDRDEYLANLQVPTTEAYLLVTGPPTDRYEFDGITLELPPPFLVMELETGVHVLSITRDAATVDHRVRCTEGGLAVVLADQVFAALSAPPEEVSQKERAALIELYAALDDTEDTREKITLCQAFQREFPGSASAAKVDDILADLRDKVAHEGESTIDVSEDVDTGLIYRQQRIEAFATAPRPPGTKGRQVAGFTLLGVAVGSGVLAVAFDATASSAASNYHNELVQGTDESAAPYLAQARQNSSGFQVSVAAAITAGTTAAVVLIADRLVHRRWLRLREELGVDKEEGDGLGMMLVPTALPDGGVGISFGGVWR